MLVSFFVIFFPQIVAEGRLYIADPPLYWIDYKPQEYVTTKKVYIDISEEIYNKKWQHVEKSGDGWAVVKDSTLFRNAVDFNRMFRLTSIYRMHKNVMFNILMQISKYIYKHNLDVMMEHSDFIKMIGDIQFNFTGKFREIYYEFRDTYIAFSGVYELKYMGMDFTYAAYVRLMDLIEVCIRLKIWDKIYIRDRKTKEVMTNIAEDPLAVIEVITSLMPKIRDRMKGLGQTNKDILARTTLDPDTRTLIQIDLNNDFATALSIIKTLRGGSVEDLAKRKEMINAFDIDPDDIDT